MYIEEPMEFITNIYVEQTSLTVFNSYNNSTGSICTD